jgi:hypothetical protein
MVPEDIMNPKLLIGDGQKLMGPEIHVTGLSSATSE